MIERWCGEGTAMQESVWKINGSLVDELGLHSVDVIFVDRESRIG